MKNEDEGGSGTTDCVAISELGGFTAAMVVVLRLQLCELW